MCVRGIFDLPHPHVSAEATSPCDIIFISEVENNQAVAWGVVNELTRRRDAGSAWRTIQSFALICIGIVSDFWGFAEG